MEEGGRQRGREGGRERGTEVRWRRRRRKEVETAFVMVRAKRITGDGEKEGGRERERRDATRGHDFILRFSTTTRARWQ